MTPRYRLFGVEVVPSVFGAGFDIIRHTPKIDDDPDEHTRVATKGLLDEALIEAREEHRHLMAIWRVSELHPAPFLLLWPREVSDGSS